MRKGKNLQFGSVRDVSSAMRDKESVHDETEDDDELAQNSDGNSVASEQNTKMTASEIKMAGINSQRRLSEVHSESAINVSNDYQNDNLARQRMEHGMRQTALIFQALRDQQAFIELNITQGEEAVLARDEMAFFMQLHQLEISNLNEAHAQDIQKLIDEQRRAIDARDERKKSKRDARASIRGTKRRDLIIQQQEKASHAAARVRDTMAEKRASFEATTAHMHQMHEIQRKNLVQSQERYYENEKLLVDLETQKMKPEVRNTHLKKFQVRQNHKAHLNKRINDNLRDLQLIEIQHAKEAFELEMVSFEELGNKRIAHEDARAALRLKHMNEMHREKENVIAKEIEKKKFSIIEKQKRELRRLVQEQKIEMKQLKLKHQKIVAQSSRAGSNASSNAGSVSASQAGSKASSKMSSMMSSVAGSMMGSVSASQAPSRGEMVDQQLNTLPDKNILSAGLNSILDENIEDEDIDGIIDGKNKVPRVIALLMKRQRKEVEAMENELSSDINNCLRSFEAKTEELNEQHQTILANLISEQEIQLRNMKEIQEKEIVFEETMHDNEMKMLIERRILNSVLQTVSDGIICITPIGTIVRFNLAAEKIFGWSANEVLGKNIKVLVPAEHAVNHDQYLQNYLTTGIKKVIGIGRKVFGMKKNGSLFPFHLSLSEVKEYGEHLFTGIVHDLTEEVAEEEKRKAIDLKKAKELEDVVALLDVENGRISSLLSQILPPSVSKQLMNGSNVKPEIYERVTVLYFDIVGFTTLSSKLEPLEIVIMLNQLYGGIDSVIAEYDVYKVETVGDCYMIASGVPKINVDHGAQIADMALHLVKAVENFVYKPKPDIKINIRVGVHTGMVVGGVVGDKMPRFCLFGETVLTANHMESTSQPSRIQISEETYKELKGDSRYRVESRGLMSDIEMNTYWLKSKEGFDPTVPVFE